jgi:hypothetical protein
MKHKYSLLGVVFALSVLTTSAQTWVGGGDEFWDNPDGSAPNWSTGVIPNSSSNVVFDSNPSATGILNSLTISSLTFTSNVNAVNSIITSGGDLTVNNSIANNGTAAQIFDVTVTAGSGVVAWDGPLSFSSNVNVGLRQVSLSGDITFGTSINFAINNTDTYGKFNVAGGSVNITGATTVNFNFGSYTGGTAGDTFDFSNGSFGTAQIGTLPTLSAGLTWNTSSFLSSGVLSVVSAVPEPSTYAALFGAAALGFAIRRKRVKA